MAEWGHDFFRIKSTSIKMSLKDNILQQSSNWDLLEFDVFDWDEAYLMKLVDLKAYTLYTGKYINWQTETWNYLDNKIKPANAWSGMGV